MAAIPIGNREIKFGTFGGVYTPSVLTIICVIFFLRLGWLVGNSGLAGALLIIFIAHTVTISTGLSISSITTNINIGAGGAYAIIARSLGLEVGGAIGIPLYFSQAISAAFYIAGFTEGFVHLIPLDHSIMNPAFVSLIENTPFLSYHQIVAVTTWAILTVIAYIGAHWAVRVYYLIMACIAVSLVSFFFGNYSADVQPILWGEFQDSSDNPENFWTAFAIFFPAVTGIMAGVSMSGDLKDARRSIPLGTMLAILTGFVVYCGGAIAYSFQADANTLLSDYNIMFKTGLLSWMFYVGVFAATLSSALGSMVAAPRVLYALGEHGVVPASNWFSQKSVTGQPRNAVMVTSAIAVVFVLTGELNSIGWLLTMFFLITYAMVNLVTFLEQAMGIVSFRPSFKVPIWVPLFGTVACVFIMFLISLVAGIIAVLITSGIYFLLARAKLKRRWGDVRSGVLSVIAGWAARQAVHLPRSEKSWRPDILVPIKNPSETANVVKLVHDIILPFGSVIAFHVTPNDRQKKLEKLNIALEPIRRDKLFFLSSVVEGTDYAREARAIIQTMREAFFRPNILFITLSDSPDRDNKVLEVCDYAIEEGMGIAILKWHPKQGLKNQETINVIMRDRSPNKNLATLLALRLHHNWNARTINLVALTETAEDHKAQTEFFEELIEEARLPRGTTIRIIDGKFPDDLEDLPECDIAIFGLGSEISTDQIREIYKHTNVTCLFIRDSGHESVYA